MTALRSAFSSGDSSALLLLLLLFLFSVLVSSSSALVVRFEVDEAEFRFDDGRRDLRSVFVDAIVEVEDFVDCASAAMVVVVVDMLGRGDDDGDILGCGVADG